MDEVPCINARWQSKIREKNEAAAMEGDEEIELSGGAGGAGGAGLLHQVHAMVV